MNMESTGKTTTGRLAAGYRELEIYKLTMKFQQSVFEATKLFPKEETYSLTDQIRRSSRSIGANIAESWAKRRYPAHFASKLTDSDGELQETMHWIRTAFAYTYFTKEHATELAAQADMFGRMLNKMIANHHQFCLTPKPTNTPAN